MSKYINDYFAGGKSLCAEMEMRLPSTGELSGLYNFTKNIKYGSAMSNSGYDRDKYRAGYNGTIIPVTQQSPLFCILSL